ncbi:4Fe-4S binding protein [Aeromicrobium sp. CTD01-1L150]|uniref:4Fe-4S binding protein n=1 Tax=Aeromicrobium sp. CTD01-1L150 TaxID=3341830 RepID=UPI0035BFDF0D
MAFAITQSCCSDASCVEVCPVDCIHPTPDEPDFGTTDILYVDPSVCIDCGACADACPASAVKPVELLRGGEEVFAELNAAYYEQRPEREVAKEQTHARVRPGVPSGLRVAVVGTGPAATYAARELLAASDAHVSFIDRLPVAGGLLRAGVAPDHGDTKRVSDTFAWTYERPRVQMYMNVEVGRHLTHAELMEHHDAVVYGVGAPEDRSLGIEGEHLPGVHGATETVAWYNGDPGTPAGAVQVQGSRAFVVGNGNVALDIARILLGDVERLAGTEIADHALAALRQADVREVVLLGRRGPEHAAFTRPELLTLPDGIELLVEDDEAASTLDESQAGRLPTSHAALLAGLPRVRSDWTAEPAPGKRLVMAFGRQVLRADGGDRLRSVTISGPEGELVAPAELLICSTGRRGRAVPGLPFDDTAGVVPNVAGRVGDPTGASVPGAYVVGWAKRGARGGIGANRTCAGETVTSLLADAAAGELPSPARSERDFGRFVASRQPRLVRGKGMRAIERAEQEAGRASGRPRVKITTVEELLATAGARR